MPPGLALLSTLTGSNYPCLELIFMVPKVFESLKFDCTCTLIAFLDDTEKKNASMITYMYIDEHLHVVLASVIGWYFLGRFSHFCFRSEPY